MDPRLLSYYNRELLYIREMGAEFAEAYPKIAARLAMEGLTPADPYVERLVESFAFLAARIQLKLDARHPDFTQHLLEMVYPHVLAPVPSFAVAELVPKLTESSLKDGYRVPRGSAMRAEITAGDNTACEYRTANDVDLWPIEVVDARYIVGTSTVTAPGYQLDSRARGAIRITLKTSGALSLLDLPLDSLSFFVHATPDFSAKVYEQVLANCVGTAIRVVSPGRPASMARAGAVRAIGFEDCEALLPVRHASFQGYRLLQEYFAFPDRFLFFAVGGLRQALAGVDGEEFELVLLLDRCLPDLENSLDASQFRLNCTPIANLFSRSLDRVHVSPHQTEHHVVPDRSRPMDFEVFGIERVLGIGSGGEQLAEVLPFYSTSHRTSAADSLSYYAVQRRPRLLSPKQQRTGVRTGYLGHECFLSLLDSRQRDLTGELSQLDIEALCTNRDLPFALNDARARLEFELHGGAPVQTVRCLAGPTLPRASPAFGDTAWKIVGQLTLNYLSLADTDSEKGAEMLRHLLALYADAGDSVAHRQVDGVRHVRHQAVVRRIPGGGPITYGRGALVALSLDDSAFEGLGTLRLGTVLERFFARYVSLNSFVETQLHSLTRGQIKQWPVRAGSRQIM